MKKQLAMKVFAVSVMLLTVTTAGAQTVNDVLNSVLGQTGQSGSSSLLSGITSLFSSQKQASTQNIVGTWVYSEPAIVLQSDNVLTSAAAKIAANKAESVLQNKLASVGIKSGSPTMTFNADGTFSTTFKGKTYKGKWTVKDSKLQLTALGVKAVSVTTQLDGKEMKFVANSTKLLNLIKVIGAKSGNTKLQTVVSLMKNVNGMEAGVTMVKK